MKGRKLIVLLSVLCMFFLNSCVSSSSVVYGVKLNVNDKPISENPVEICIKSNNTSLPEYQDSILRILWDVDVYQLKFTISNLSDQSIKIIWDECVFGVPSNNSVSKIVHKGISIADAYHNRTFQVPTIIPSNRAYSDIIIPLSHVVVDDDGEVSREQLFYKKSNAWFKKHFSEYVGNVYAIYMPIMVNDQKTMYMFEIIIDNVEISKNK